MRTYVSALHDTLAVRHGVDGFDMAYFRYSNVGDAPNFSLQAFVDGDGFAILDKHADIAESLGIEWGLSIIDCDAYFDLFPEGWESTKVAHRNQASSPDYSLTLVRRKYEAFLDKVQAKYAHRMLFIDIPVPFCINNDPSRGDFIDVLSQYEREAAAKWMIDAYTERFPQAIITLGSRATWPIWEDVLTYAWQKGVRGIRHGDFGGETMTFYHDAISVFGAGGFNDGLDHLLFSFFEIPDPVQSNAEHRWDKLLGRGGDLDRLNGVFCNAGSVCQLLSRKRDAVDAKLDAWAEHVGLAAPEEEMIKEEVVPTEFITREELKFVLAQIKQLEGVMKDVSRKVQVMDRILKQTDFTYYNATKEP